MKCFFTGIFQHLYQPATWVRWYSLGGSVGVRVDKLWIIRIKRNRILPYQLLRRQPVADRFRIHFEKLETLHICLCNRWVELIRLVVIDCPLKLYQNSSFPNSTISSAYRVSDFSPQLIKMPSLKNVVTILLSMLVSTVMSGSKNKPHGHTGVLDHYDGKLLPFKISADQSKKLDSGEPVRLD